VTCYLLRDRAAESGGTAEQGDAGGLKPADVAPDAAALTV